MNNTKTQNLPFATDEECEQLRLRLVRAGKIIPAGRRAAIQTQSQQVRIADPPAAPRPRRNAADIPEEGVYRVRKISSDEEYERRKNNYFIMLQSILKSRIELGLEFGEHGDYEELEESDG